ncbi:unnamed protein product, partial [marine sediment metagenome]
QRAFYPALNLGINEKPPFIISNMPEQAHELAYKLACEQLASIDIEEICSKTGTQYITISVIIASPILQGKSEDKDH